MPNQFTKAEQEGREKPEARNQYSEPTGITKPHKDKIRAEMLSQRLEQFIAGEVELSPAQVSAAKILIDKGKPSLQAVQQSHEDPWADKSEQELMDSVRALISSHPALLAQFRSLVEPVKEVEAPQQLEKSA